MTRIQGMSRRQTSGKCGKTWQDTNRQIHSGAD